ncbi:tRNA pseudouridine(65) synthase TruC [Gallaecimonas sp. GXIMD4217]|uniref:tRNA pseudouridine(65) synthase TruC n=1 Tax=Gallaecimonas sp. GXIMD4217 TaxID=3131927 RepID=UPI00311AD4AA
MADAPQLTILYQDEHLVAIDKPPGLLVHRSKLAKGERFFAMQLLRDQLGQHVYPVHRLDKPTRGVLLFALSSEMARLLSAQFEARAVVKKYLALARGHVLAGDELDYPLVEELDKTTDGRACQDKGPQQAVTRYEPLAHVELPYAVGRYPSARYSLVACRPLTGRKHQIRRHFHHLSHHLIGDTTHGDGRHNRLFRNELDFSELALWAHELRLNHPVTGESLVLRSALPDSWAGLFARFGWDGQALLAEARKAL